MKSRKNEEKFNASPTGTGIGTRPGQAHRNMSPLSEQGVELDSVTAWCFQIPSGSLPTFVVMYKSLYGTTDARWNLMRSQRVKVVLLFATLAFSGANAQLFSLEQPKYQSLEKEAEFELRLYKPMLVAEVVVEGDLTSAGKEGARLVKQYIFREGPNASLDPKKQASDQISMTLPVTMEKKQEKISMTLPVTMEAKSKSTYRLHFVMPSSYTLDTLPKSADPRVTVRAIPEQRIASIRFSKFSTEANVAEQTSLLMNWMDKKGLVANAAPQFARYDPPSVPPLLRRSEILIPVQ